MLYKKSKEAVSDAGFRNPDACYRGAPFWAWNGLITKEMIDEQIQAFRQMGMGGFHIHVRVGLKNQYMGDEFLELVHYCDEKAKEAGLLCWLYDEDRYASGTAGGEVTKKVEFRARMLRLTVKEKPELSITPELFSIKQGKNEKVPGCLLKVYDIVLQDGYLKKVRLIGRTEEAEGTKWYLYEELAKESPWYNNQTYVDTMNREATEYFIRKTHEKYASVLGSEFGRSVPAIFTDEPHFIGNRLLRYAEGEEDILLPFTDSLPEKYSKFSGRDFYMALPGIIWNSRENAVSPERYFFYKTCCELFVSSYCMPIGKWCEEHGILSTGHILSEESLNGQTGAVGDAMRCYQEFQLPGIDNLCDHREFGAVKQASSIARQYGREGVVSELYGVTQWDFDFEGYKLAGDWQAALGITTRVHHLAWASMAGEAKRDYPAAIGWQSPWYQDFHYIEDHFSRVNYCMTRGVPLVHVGILHPIESMWLLQGPMDQMGEKRKKLETDFQDLTNWILTGGIDFDYISESSLGNLPAGDTDGQFVCGEMKYDVVLVPDCINLRGTTLERLTGFLESGGKVILCGDIPQYVDCLADSRLETFRNKCGWIPLTYDTVLEALEPWREMDVRGADGCREKIYVHQFRQDGEERWLFLAQAYKGMASRNKSVWNWRALHAPERLNIRLKGDWRVEKYDTLTGEIYKMGSRYEEGHTSLEYDMYGDDSLLLHLIPAGRTDKEEAKDIYVPLKAGEKKISVPEPLGYEASEPNVLLLDRWEYALDDEEYREECELLRADNILRKRLGYPLRSEFVEQPYVRKEKDVREHMVRLRARIKSETSLADCLLALEEPEFCRGILNGREICMEPVGFYVDKAIRTIRLPEIRQGINELELNIRYGKATNLEWMYVLGEFGVRVLGKYTVLEKKPDRLFWGDYTRQGFPFYTGNMTYYVNVVSDGKQPRAIQIPYYSGAAVKVSVNGGREQMTAFLPCECPLDNLKAGDNQVAITCLGNRYNGFGQLHMIGDDVTWLGPDSWRTEGCSWAEEYQLKPMGILGGPLLT